MKLLLFCASLLLPVLASAESPWVTLDGNNGTPVPVVGSGLGFNGTPIPVLPHAGTPQPTPAAAETTPIAQSIMLPTSIPTLFPVTPNALVNTAALKRVCILNTFNVDVWCTYGAPAATPIPFKVPAGAENCDPFANDGLKMSTGVSCIKPGAATPASGELAVRGYQ